MASGTVAARVITEGSDAYPRKSAVSLLTRRAFDLAVAITGLALGSPMLLVAAALIKLDSRGPVFYRQTRVGLHRARFEMLKFRKMPVDLPSQGPMLTTRYDQRLTRVGRMLERTKLDELPQLFNVLWGHMSIIGPRPEVPKFVEFHPELWDVVLSTKPGIFGPSQLKNRNESELYPPGGEDVEKFYVESILPEKLQVDAAYALEASLLRDIGLLVGGLFITVFGAITWRTVVTRRMQLANFTVLYALGLAGTGAAILMSGQDLYSTPAVQILLMSAFAKPISIVLLKVPKALATSMTPRDIQRLFSCTLASTSMMAFAAASGALPRASWLAVVLDSAFFLTVLCAYKLLVYTVYLVFVQESESPHRRSVWASSVIAPLSVAVVFLGRTFTDGSKGIGANAYFTMAFVAMFVRPLIATMLFRQTPEQGERSWIMTEWPRLLMVTMAGSSVILLVVKLVDPNAIPLVDIVADMAVFGGLATAFSVRSGGWSRASESDDAKSRSASRSSIIVVGSGIELSAYVASLDGVPAHAYEFIGIVTPHLADRLGTVGGHRVVGEITDLPEILETLVVDTLVVLESALDEPLREFVERTAARYKCEYFGTHILPGWSPNGHTHLGAGPTPELQLTQMESSPQGAA